MGHTASQQVVDAIEQRLSEGPAAAHLTLTGRPVAGLFGSASGADIRVEVVGPFGPGFGPMDAGLDGYGRSVAETLWKNGRRQAFGISTLRDVLWRSSFSYSLADKEAGSGG